MKVQIVDDSCCTVCSVLTSYSCTCADDYDHGYGHNFNSGYGRGYYGDQHGNFHHSGGSSAAASASAGRKLLATYHYYGYHNYHDSAAASAAASASGGSASAAASAAGSGKESSRLRHPCRCAIVTFSCRICVLGRRSNTCMTLSAAFWLKRLLCLHGS